MRNQKSSSPSPKQLLRNLDTIRRRAVGWGEELRQRTRDRPGRSIAIAVGAGFLLGGGLFSSVSARLLATGIKAGLKLALVPFLAQSLAVVAERSFLSGDKVETDSA